MPCVVIEAFKESVMILCTPFAHCCLVYSDWTLYHLGYIYSSSSPRLDGMHAVQIYLIGIQDSPDHRCARNKELSLYEITRWGQDLVSVVHIRERPYHRGFFYMKILSGHWNLFVIERCPY